MIKKNIPLTALEITNLIAFIEGYDFENIKTIKPDFKGKLKLSSEVLYSIFQKDKAYFKVVSPEKTFNVFFTAWNITTIKELVKYSTSPLELEKVSQKLLEAQKPDFSTQLNLN